MELDDFQRLSKRLERLKTELAESQGKLTQLLTTLQEESGAKTVAEATLRLEDYEKDLAEQQRCYDREQAQWERDYRDRLLGS